MEWISVFFWTLLIVGVGELGDKTQIAAGSGTLANRKNIKIIFFSSSLALITVAGFTTLFAGIIPANYLPKFVKAGGFLLILYGIYLFEKSDNNDSNTDKNNSSTKDKCGLFFTHFIVVFMAELGDKTQFATLAIAVDNQTYLFIVFLSSALALILVTAVTVWGVTKIPLKWITKVKKLGAVLMMAYGIHMVV